MHTLLRCALLVTLTVGPVFAQSPEEKDSVARVEALLQQVGEPLHQILIQQTRAGNVYQTLDSTILPAEHYIKVVHRQPDGSSYNYILYRGQLLRQLGSSLSWTPVREEDHAEALQTMARVLTAASTRNLADWLAAPQEGLSFTPAATPPDIARVRPYLQAIADQKGGGFIASASPGIRVEGRKRADSLSIQYIEDFRGDRLFATATTEPATADGFVPPELTRFTEVTINHLRRQVKETLITQAPSPTGLVVDVSGDRLWVLGVRPDSPAARAGIRGGDEIVRLNGKPVDSLDLAEVLPQLRTLQTASLDLQDAHGEPRRATIE